MNDAELLAAPEPDFVVPDGFESLDGRLVELPTSEKAAWIGGELFALIWVFLRANPLGRVYPQNTAFRCFPNRPRHVRKPDVAFVRAERVISDLSDQDIRIHPDLVVEVVSPTETVQDLNAKIGDYRSVGVPLIWVVDPNAR